MPNKAQREELKHFLRTRRERLSPRDFGLPPGTRRRTPGLRRDEVALIANIGTSTYTFLEQGRDINISISVVDRLASVLKLSPQEKRHFYRLTIGDLPSLGQPTESMFESMRDILEYLQPCPAIILNHRFEIVAFNEISKIVYGYPTDAVEQRYNIVEKIVTDLGRRQLFANLPEHMKDLLGYFRLSYARFSDDQELVRLVQNLEAKSEEFRQFWQKCNVIDVEYSNTVIRVVHRDLGNLAFRFSFFELFGCSHSLTVGVPLPGTDTREKLVRALNPKEHADQTWPPKDCSMPDSDRARSKQELS